jgi:hypothetical protein
VADLSLHRGSALGTKRATLSESELSAPSGAGLVRGVQFDDDDRDPKRHQRHHGSTGKLILVLRHDW